MGSHERIGARHSQFPRQSPQVGRTVQIVFQYDHKQVGAGRIVRYDVEAPYEVLIELTDGRFVRGSEVHVRPF